MLIFLNVDKRIYLEWKIYERFRARAVQKLCARFDVSSVDKFKVSDLASGLNNRGTTPQISYTKGVPYYNVDFIGGFDIVLNDQTISPEYLIDFRKYNEATCWCNVTGHSMEPEITHGDIIALKKLKTSLFYHWEKCMR